MSLPPLPPFASRPTVRIDLKTLKSNYQALCKRAATAKVGASVKADAYGLGAERVGKTLYGAGCRVFFVATAGEGKILRQAIGEQASIYLLSGSAPRDMGLIMGSRLKPVLNSLLQARIWSKAVKDMQSPPACAVHIDTGMNRLGFCDDEYLQFIADSRLRQPLYIDLVMSHLACAPDANADMNADQNKRFKTLSARLPAVPKSLANTAGIYLGRGFHHDIVRPGIGLYGGHATNLPQQEVSQPVVELLATVLHIGTLQAGQTVGYNATFKAQSAMKIATVGAGYADGIPVSASSTREGPAFTAHIHGQDAPVIGRVSMDLTVLDVTNISQDVNIGDRATFRGKKLEEEARRAQTLNYELLTRLNSGRCRREYI